MTPDEFKAWRQRLNLSREEAAERLGLSASCVKTYELGRRRADGPPLEIPKTVRLACASIQAGILEYTPAG